MSDIVYKKKISIEISDNNYIGMIKFHILNKTHFFLTQQTITLDFQGFTKEWDAAKQSSANKLTSSVASGNAPKLDSRDVDSLQEQKRHLMRGMLILDAESTDLTADFESRQLTEYVYRQRMLENRQLYRTLMTQLIKVAYNFVCFSFLVALASLYLVLGIN